MKPDKKQIVLICVILAMLGVFVFMQYIPTVKAIEEAKESKQKQKTEQEQLQDQLEKLPQLQKELEKIKSEIGDFEKRIPSNRDLGAFLQDVTTMMNSHSLSNQLVRPGKEEKYQQVNVIPIDIECSGDLNQIFKFFKQMQGNERLFRLEKLRFENKNLSGNIKVYAKGNIFYRQES